MGYRAPPKHGEARGCYRCGGDPGVGEGCAFCNRTGWLIWEGTEGHMRSRPFAAHDDFSILPLTGALTEDAMPTPEDDDAIVTLRENINVWLMAMQLEGEAPMTAASKLFDVLVQVITPVMGLGAIRTALMMVFESTYEQPTTFMQRNEAKKLLDAVSNARRAVEGKPHLILPDEPA